MRVLVAGAGGALGGWLVKSLCDDGFDVRAVDSKDLSDWWQVDERSAVWDAMNLSTRDASDAAVYGCEWVFDLAADMGGIGHITSKEADCAFTVLTTANLLQSAVRANVSRFLFTSSACIYPTTMQEDAHVTALKESDAWPALPDHGYGLEKLFGEKLCEYATKDYGLQTRVARLHNVYGPFGAWTGGREKAPAAICRKVAEAKLSGAGVIDIWGDGEQTRSFMYVGDFVEGVRRLMSSDYRFPVNLGTSELVTINQLVSIVEELAGVTLERRYDLTAPQGVRGRNSDNMLIRQALNWEPSITLKQGLRILYPWVEEEVAKARSFA